MRTWMQRVTSQTMRVCCYALSAVLMTAALGGCGFQLRGAAGTAMSNLPFTTLTVQAPANSSVAQELRANLRVALKENPSTQLVDKIADAQARIQILNDQREKVVLSLDGQGRVQEYELRHRVVFRMHDGRERDYINDTEIVLRRTLSFNTAIALAKESEETALYREMQTDAVQQILRRVAAVRN